MLKKTFLHILFVSILLPTASFAHNFTPPTNAEMANKKIGTLSILGAIDMSSYQYLAPIRQALKDDSIAGVIVTINSGGGSCGIGEAIQVELQKLNAQKPVYIVATNRCGSMGYIIASAGRKIYATPSSVVGHIGILSVVRKFTSPTVTRHKNKFNIEYLHAGDHVVSWFKETDDLTTEEREGAQQEISQLYDYYCAGIAKARNLSLETKVEWANGIAHYGLQAQRLGLIDAIGTWDDAYTALNEELLTSKIPLSTIDLMSPPEPVHNEQKTGWSDKVVQLYLTSKSLFQKSVPPSPEKSTVGIVHLHLDEDDDDSDNQADDFLIILKEASQNEKLSGLLVTINATELDFGIGESLYLELKHIESKIPVVVWIVNDCCSSAYLLASAATEIVAPYGSSAGGIGIWHEINKVVGKPKDQHKNEYTVEYIFAGEHKVCEFAGSQDLTKQERSYIQDGLDEIYEHYCCVIAQSRNLSLDKKHVWANGLAFLAPKCKQLGLIDSIGSISDVESTLQELIRTKTDNPKQEFDFVELVEKE